MFFFPGCHGGEGREEGKEGSGKMDEDMSVGESTKSTVHVDAQLLQK